MKISRPQKSSFAFTLLEIMVSIALLAMIVVAIYSSWNSILKGSRVALDAAASAQRTRITMRMLHDSLLCACMYNSNVSNYYFLASMDGEDSSLSFVAHLPRSFLRHGKFGDLSVRRVQFSVEQGSGSRKKLVMRQRPIIMGDFDDDESKFPLVLANDITQFKAEYLDPQTGDFVTDWQYTNQLPKEIRITIGVGRKDNYTSEPQEKLFAVIAPPANAVAVQWQMPNGFPGAPPINPNQSAPVGNQPLGGNQPPGGNATQLVAPVQH